MKYYNDVEEDIKNLRKVVEEEEATARLETKVLMKRYNRDLELHNGLDGFEEDLRDMMGYIGRA